MFRKMTILILPALALSGCKTLVSSDIYLTDVAAVVANGQSIPLDLKLAFEVPSDDHCAQAKEMLAPALEEHFGPVVFTGCSKRDFSNFANFTAGSEMVLELENGENDSPLPIYVGVFVPEEGNTEVSYHTSQEGLQALITSLPEEARAYSRRLQVELSATIHNDAADPAEVMVAGAFVNGSPALRPVDLKLERRKELAVRLSDVANTLVSQGSWANIVAIRKPAQ